MARVRTPGVDRVGPGAGPHLALFGRYVFELLPSAESFAAVVLAVGGRHLAVERDRHVAAAQQRQTQGQDLLRGHAVTGSVKASGWTSSTAATAASENAERTAA